MQLNTQTLNPQRFILGCWRLNQWQLSRQELNQFIQQVQELGINVFDHADIYGGYTCEELFGNALKLSSALRQKIKLTSKCGIKLVSDKFPEHSRHIYDTSYQHIIAAANRSLVNLATDYLDLFLIHRPDPLTNAGEVARAFTELRQSGKVLNFGVSNFLPTQFELLQTYLDFPLQTNQIEASVLCHEHFTNGNLDYLQAKKVIPQIWSPLAGGLAVKPLDAVSMRVYTELEFVAKEYATSPDIIALAWLLKLPVQAQIVLGSGSLSRISKALSSLNIDLSREDWFRIWTSYTGHDIA